MDIRRRTALKAIAVVALLPTLLRAAAPAAAESALLPDLPIIDPHHYFRQLPIRTTRGHAI